MNPAQYHRHYLHSGQKLYLEIVRTKRKTLAMHVFPGERVTEVRVPLKCSWKEIDHFIEARLDWLLEARNKLALVPADPTFTSGQVHSFLGDAYQLTVYPGRTRVMLAPGEILLSCRDPASESQVQTAFYHFLRQQADIVFAERYRHCIDQFPIQVAPARLRIRRMKARWGSCSEQGEICLNSLLVQKPIAAIDMVITHELCHLIHFRHDHGFYNLMDQAMPDWRDRESLLAVKPEQSPPQSEASGTREQLLLL